MAEEMTVLITVKAYPAISKTKGENICVAGIRTGEREQQVWVRLWPVPYRDMAFQQRFTKYQLITLRATKSTRDNRPESYAPDVDSITLGQRLPAGNWNDRRPYVESLIGDSMCELYRRQRIDGTSLGVIKPTDVELDIVPDTDVWDPAKQGVIDQPSLFMPEKDGLEKGPFRFVYRSGAATWLATGIASRTSTGRSQPPGVDGGPSTTKRA